VSYVNDVHVIAQNDAMASVNATLEIELNGAYRSKHLKGRQFTGSGAQIDFVRGAYASNDRKSIIACHATAGRRRLAHLPYVLQPGRNAP